MILLGLIVCAGLCRGQSGPELFQNPGMEDPDIVSGYGHAWGYKVERVSDSHTGSYAVKLSGRTAYWQGIGQDVRLTPGSRYSIHAYIKQLNGNQKLWQKFAFSAAYQWNSNKVPEYAKMQFHMMPLLDVLGKIPWISHGALHIARFMNSTQKLNTGTSYMNYAERAFATQQDGWFKLGGDFTPPSKPWYKLRIYIQGPDPGIEFLVDDLSLKEIPENLNWKTEANQRIDNIRKSNFTLSVTVEDKFDPTQVEIEIKHKRHQFAFGSLVSDDYIVNPSYTGYQNLFYEFFNWATVGSYKWKYNQGNRTHPNYDRSLMATDELRKHGMPVRGHNMFWGVSANTPAWALKETADQLNATIRERIRFMTGITKGKLTHWDVNNELLHGQEYEEITKDPTYSQEIYRLVHQLDPTPKLFLNDYNVVAVGANTDDYINQGNSFKAANVGLYGLGLQSHFKAYVAPDPTLLKYRLDKLASTGLPLWITEMTLSNSDENTRADWIENALITYFSHPAVEGVILWGFWDEFSDPDSSLVNGNYYFINAAGKRWLDLIKSQWSTHVKKSLMTKHTSLDIRGFHGDYDVIVRYQGRPIQLDHFLLGKSDGGKHINITVSGDGHEITLPTSKPTSVPIHNIHHVTHGHTQTIGHAATQAQQVNMTCVTRWSSLSAVGDDKAADASCFSDEIMTGCSSLTKDGLSFRDGELIVSKSGKPYCRAVNAWRSSAPDQAAARCCKKTGLQCTYMAAGPSTNGEGDQIQVTCPLTLYATGCTSYTYYGAMDGAFSDGQNCTAQNDGTKGVFTYAACCGAPSTTCEVKTSPAGGIRQGDISSVACSQGETMAGCSVFSEDGHTAGAYIDENDRCLAVNGLDRFPGEEGVKAVAVCCT